MLEPARGVGDRAFDYDDSQRASLHSLSGDLFSELSARQAGVSPAAVAAAAAAAAAASGAVVARLSGPDELELVGVAGIVDPGVRGWRRQRLDADSVLAEAVRKQRPVVARGALLPGVLGTGSAVGLPLTVEGRRIGALGLEYAAARTFRGHDRARFDWIATTAADAFDRILAQHLSRVEDRGQRLETPREVAEEIVAQGVDALGALGGALALLDGERRRLWVVASRGYPPELTAPSESMPIDYGVPLAEAARTGELIVLESADELDERYPAVRLRRGGPGDYVTVALPLPAGEEPFGALAFTLPASRTLDRAERAFLLSVSRVCAQALERVGRARIRDRTARLQAVTSELTKALTQADVGHIVIDEARAVLGARAGRVTVVDPSTGRLVTIARAGYPGRLESRLRDVGEEMSMPAGVAVSRDEPVLIGSLEEARAEWPVAARVLGRLGDRAMAAIPLRSRDRVIGAISFTWDEERRFLEDDVSFLGALAGVCAQALEPARLYEESERSRNHLRHLLDHLGEAVITVDSELRVTYANEEASQILGGRRLVGGPLPSPWPELRLRELASSQIGADAEALDERTTLADGRTLEVLAMPSDGGATLVLRDVSRRERQERAEREFVANAAHELRTPLAAIATAADALERGAKDVPTERDFFIAGIVSEVDRLVRLSDALLLLARVQADPGTLRQERVEIEPLLTDIAARLEVRPAVRVVVDCAGGVFCGERSLLEAALTNVARNASRHTSSGSITFSCHQHGRHLVIEVSDTGVGMSDKVRVRATARFFRGGERDRDGFGLGLAIAEEMVHALGGEFEIASKPRVGTTITIRLAAA